MMLCGAFCSTALGSNLKLDLNKETRYFSTLQATYDHFLTPIIAYVIIRILMKFTMGVLEYDVD